MVNALTEYQFHLPFTSREKIGEKNITNANLIHPFVVEHARKIGVQGLTNLKRGRGVDFIQTHNFVRNVHFLKKVSLRLGL